ncbi:MAG: hypothetical protein AAF458_08675 [Pseudomonadota bacterium]
MPALDGTQAELNMSLQFHDPRAEPMVAATPYTLRTDLDRPLNIGLLANGFPDSVNFLDRVQEALSEKLPQAAFHRYDKGNASAIVSGEMLDDIIEKCDVAVAAYGH